MGFLVKELEQTCEACPSQWKAKLECGKMAYIRYRYGTLTVSISNKKTDDVIDAVRGETVYQNFCGDSLDGVMDTEKMMDMTSDILIYDFSDKTRKLFKFIEEYTDLRESGFSHEETIMKLEEEGYFSK